MECIAKNCKNRSIKRSFFCSLCKKFMIQNGFNETNLNQKNFFSIIKTGEYYNDYNNDINSLIFKKNG